MQGDQEGSSHVCQGVSAPKCLSPASPRQPPMATKEGTHHWFADAFSTAAMSGALDRLKARRAGESPVYIKAHTCSWELTVAYFAGMSAAQSHLLNDEYMEHFNACFAAATSLEEGTAVR